MRPIQRSLDGRLRTLPLSLNVFPSRRLAVLGEMKSEAAPAEPNAALAARLGVSRTDPRAAVGTLRDGKASADCAPLVSDALDFEDPTRLHS